MARPYHHGDLRRALLDAAISELAHTPASQLSLRALARRVGVSHAAPAHHFGDRHGLLEAIARHGFIGLRDALSATRDAGGTFLDLGVTYVTWSVDHPAEHQVMFGSDVAPDRLDDVRAQTRELLGAGAAEVADGRDTAVAGWAIAHGLATLLIDGQITDPRPVPELAVAVLGELGRPVGGHRLHRGRTVRATGEEEQG